MAGSPPTTATSPTLPKSIPDLPVSIVLAVLYFIAAQFMIRRLLQSRKRFRVGALLIGFCMSRVVTFSVRAAWSQYPQNAKLAIAATVFVSAGVILAVAVNMQLVIRLAKSLRPSLQCNMKFRHVTHAIQLFMIAVLIMTIAPAIVGLLTTNPHVKAQTQIPLKISSTYISIYSWLPFVLAPTLYFAFPRGPILVAKRLHVRVLLIMWISLCLGLELTIKCANIYRPAHLHSWYGTRWGFYVFTPMLELLVIVPIIALDLCHLFGDSNASVLDAINADGSDEDEESSVDIGEKEKIDDGTPVPSRHNARILEALSQTTSNYVAGRWSHVESL